MTYEIGQKVETPFGKGIVTFLSNIGDDEIDSVWVSFKNVPEIEFSINVIKPYKTPHERLLEIGLNLKITKNWAGGVFSHEWWNDNNDRVVVFFVDEKVTTVYEGNNDIMRIIPDYLEWLEEQK